MSLTRQRSFRWSEDTLSSLERHARLRGEAASRLAERLVEEGLRMEEHPGIVFRDGPAGRRAALAAGPDVWELVRFARAVESTGTQRVEEIARTVSLTAAQVETAMHYYADYPDEIDERIRQDEEEAARAESQWRRRRAAFG